MPRLYESRCRMCGQCAVLHGYCRMCGTPHATPTADPTNQPVVDPVPPTNPTEDPDAPESRTDAPADPVEGHGPYDDDFPDRFDLGQGG